MVTETKPDLGPGDLPEVDQAPRRSALADLVGMSDPSDKIVITRTKPDWLKGFVDEFDVSEGESISWREIERKHGGGEYLVTLLAKKQSGLKGSIKVFIPGLPKYKGTYVGSEEDLERLIKGSPAGPSIGQVSESATVQALKSFAETMDRVLERQEKAQAENTQLILTSLNDLRSKQADPLMDAVRTLGQIQRISSILTKFPGMAPAALPAREVASEPGMDPISAIIDRVAPMVVEKFLGSVFGGPVLPAVDPERGPGNEPPLTDAEKADLGS